MKANELKKLQKTTNPISAFAQKFDAHAKKHAKSLWYALLLLIILLITAMVAGVWCNIHGYREINYYIAIGVFIVSLVMFTRPELLIALLKMDIINMFVPQKFQLDLEDTILMSFLHIVKRTTAFCVGAFLFLGYIPIKDSVELFILLLIGSIIFILIYTE